MQRIKATISKRKPTTLFKLGLTEEEKAAREQVRANKEKIRDKYIALAKEAGLTNCRIR